MEYRVELTNRAKKGLRALGRADQAKCLAVIEALATNPKDGAQKLKGTANGYKVVVTYHVRVVFTVDDAAAKVVVTNVGQREGVYR